MKPAVVYKRDHGDDPVCRAWPSDRPHCPTRLARCVWRDGQARLASEFTYVAQSGLSAAVSTDEAIVRLDEDASV